MGGIILLTSLLFRASILLEARLFSNKPNEKASIARFFIYLGKWGAAEANVNRERVLQ
jgi:hypothetical protein